MLIPFGEWRPDMAEFGNPGSLTVKNVIPAKESYRPFPNLSAITNALTARCQGAHGARDAANNVYTYAGDATKLYEGINNTFTDQSVGGGYTTAATDAWEFAEFGANIIATNFTDPVQTMAIGGGGAGAFANSFTSTLKPKAKHLAVIRDFLVLGNTSDGTDGHVPYRVWWGGINSTVDMDPDSTTQCDYQDMAEGGWVNKIAGGAEYGVIFQERQISRMAYIGTPLVFDFYPVDRKRGTQIPGSVAIHGRLMFYISEEGFFAFDGSQSHPIGVDKVDKTFWAEFDLNNKHFVSSAIDPVNKLVVWSFPGTGNTGGAPNKLYIYNWVYGKWAFVEIDTEFVTSTSTQGYTLDGLDSVGTDIDDPVVFAESFDSDVWKGGKIRFGAFDASHKLGYFSGSNLAATIDTSEAQLLGGQRSMITATRPIVDGGTPTVRIRSRNRTTDAATFSSSVTINSIGECPVRTNARYLGARMEMAAGQTWTHAQGIEVPEEHVRPMGKR
jgi:hypothetical protein